ncbi:MAG TPA: hypothetical protein ENN39_08185 [Desulfonatronum sp.]|nr:hypothetical protein [Desulfonatronum sp.]
MSDISEMADDLATEVLSEAAETFFGQRKELESETELFEKRIKALAETGLRVLHAQKIMHRILINKTLIQDFYQVLELPMPEHFETAEVHEVALQLRKPFAWTLRGRFFKLLMTSYSRLQLLVHEYLHGGYRKDPGQPRKKIAVFGYVQMQEWAQRINQKIAKMNTCQAPSEVLQFVKKLDVHKCEMEKCTGASCEVARDNGLLFPYVDFSAYCLPVFPEMPLPAHIRRPLSVFCNALFPQRKKEIQGLFQGLANAWGKRLQDKPERG